MKPADHPEFFRLPPPEGRSRESSIRLDAEGRFWHEGALVEHAKMARAFASWIDRHPDDGRYILNNGFDWTYIQVDGAPFFVVRLVEAPEDEARPLRLSLSDGTEESLDPGKLWLDRQGVLYTEVKSGAFRARFSRQAQIALGERVREGEGGAWILELGGRSYDIRGIGPGS